jgi:hypothetical protein
MALITDESWKIFFVVGEVAFLEDVLRLAPLQSIVYCMIFKTIAQENKKAARHFEHPDRVLAEMVTTHTSISPG